MLKELKYLLYILVILFFSFFIIKYYFSDDNEKNYYLNMKNIDKLINKKTKKLKVLDSNTDKIIEYSDIVNDDKSKNFYFWELLKSDKN
tara:strand:+ start:327 stop:593 length:267 start_codon:yes stop_codon:yes gene_type:complete